MKQLIQIEFLKTKRSFVRYIYLATPFILLLFTLLSILHANDSNGLYESDGIIIPVRQASFFNLWPLIISHSIIIIGTYFNLNIDKKSRYLESCLSNNWNLITNFIAKSIVLTFYFALSTLIFSMITIYSVYITTGQVSNFRIIIETAGLIFFSQICLIQINITLLRYFNVIIVFILYLILIIVSVYTVLSDLFWLVPHGYGLKIAMIMMGIHPNGIPLEINDIHYSQIGDMYSLYLTMMGSFIFFLIAFAINIATLHYKKQFL
ncbi:MAG: hypothetical protein GKC53_05910 [Neisseriaceae bacterium]|nr:MAG: hypothetical protein GKC53_05910 [Neisseriaceae bacterium]